jgi:hypothetical protein
MSLITLLTIFVTGQTDRGEWRHLQDSHLTYRSKPLKVRLFWGDQRMGLLRIEAQGKRLYEGIRSWNWCVLAYPDKAAEPLLLANGYWDVQSKPETSYIPLRKGAPNPLTATDLKRLENACQTYKRGSRFVCLVARRQYGAWKLEKAPTVLEPKTHG